MTVKENHKRPKGLFYCQPALGYGHFIRSLHICQGLIKEYDIDFLMGALDIGHTIDSPNFHLHFLPPLHIKDLEEAINKFEDPIGKLTLQEVLEKRKIFLEGFLKQSYDFFITELFPFSKLPLTDEILQIIKSVKSINPKCLIVCSLREMLLPIPPARQQAIADIFKENYDYVFVHSDPRIYRLENIVKTALQFPDKIIYTGYVTNPEPLIKPEKRQKRILVSMGGGRYGKEMYLAIAKTASAFPDYEFIFIKGPLISEELLKQLEDIKKEKNLTNITFKGFVKDFLQVMQDSALSINLGGATILDAVKTETPSIVYPYAHDEHIVRAQLFGLLDLVKMLDINELNPEQLTRIIHEVLSKPYPNYKIDLSGVESTSSEIHRLTRQLK